MVAPVVATLLLRPGEMPGFVFSGPRKVSSSPDDFAPTRKDAVRLRSEGFVDGATQQLQGTGSDRGAIAITVGFIFATPSAAQRELLQSLAESLRTQGSARTVRLTIAAVPTARGYTAISSGGDRATNVFFRAGRCLLLVGDVGRRSRLAAVVKAAVVAVYRRVAGTC